MSVTKSKIVLITLFAITIALNIALWSSVRSVLLEWTNVPPPPSVTRALWSSLGDPQFAYRSYGIMLQAMGDTGGRVINLAEYDYETLGRWFRLTYELDPVSDFAPFLAGYFFGAVKTPEKLPPIIDYLELAAGDGEGQKWRFLGQAAFLARFKMKDMERALELAHKLSAFENPDMATWARQMPVFIMTAQGEKEAAYDLMINILKSDADNLHPNEVNATLEYICTRILNEQEAMANPLCGLAP